MGAPGGDDHPRVHVADRPPYLAACVAASPQLRRDIANAVAAGVSPRRYAGWEPRTVYNHDQDGRTTWSEPEPEWDELDTALVDALTNWQAGVHTCGHHEDEQADPDSVFVAGFTLCRACEVLQAAQDKQAKTDEPERKKGRNPDYARRWTVHLRSRAQLQRETAERASRPSPQQLMDEAVARMEVAGS